MNPRTLVLSCVTACTWLATPVGAQEAKPAESPSTEASKPTTEGAGSLLPCLPAKKSGAPADYADTLRRAREAMNDVRHEEALALVLGVGPDAPPRLRMEALAIGATMYLVLGHAVLAQRLLEELYFLAPGYVFDNPAYSDTIAKMFDEEAARPHKRAVKMQLRPLPSDLLGFEIDAAGATAAVDVACRVAGRTGPFAPVKVSFRHGKARFGLPAKGRFECHAVANDRDGLPLGRLGTPKSAVIVTSREPPPPPLPPPRVWERWYFWAGVSTVVVGGVVATIALTARETELPPADIDVPVQPTGLTVWRW